MDAKRALLIISACVLARDVADAGNENDQVSQNKTQIEEHARSDSTASRTIHPRRIGPLIYGQMTEAVRLRLEAGFAIAVERVQEVPQCAALFEDLGADALDALSTGVYSPVASHWREKTLCQGAVAFTNVGSPLTFLCRGFGRLSEKQAATYILHEALHHAGLDEYPHDRDSMTSPAINKMVTKACQF